MHPVGTDLCVCSYSNENVCSSSNEHIHPAQNEFVCSSSKENLCSFQNESVNPTSNECVVPLKKKELNIGNVNKVGQMVEKWWLQIPHKFESIEIDKFVVMPNHFHGILILKYNPIYIEEQTHRSVPTIDNKTHRSVPTIDNKTHRSVPTIDNKTHRSVPTIDNKTHRSVPTIDNKTHRSVPTIDNKTHRSTPTIDHNIFGNVDMLGKCIRWFKTMTTNEYIRNVNEHNWPRFNKQLWQPRFHDRIIRSEKEYWAKRIYIENNPKNWGNDSEQICRNAL
jgi:REP element-mobilizing transposase RayT